MVDRESIKGPILHEARPIFLSVIVSFLPFIEIRLHFILGKTTDKKKTQIALSREKEKIWRKTERFIIVK